MPKHNKLFIICIMVFIPLFLIGQGGISYPYSFLAIDGTPVQQVAGRYSYGSQQETMVITSPTPGNINFEASFPYAATIQAEPGDVPRFGQNSFNSKYTPVSAFARQVAFAVEGSNGGSAAFVSTGANTTLNTIGTPSNISPTATEGFGLKFTGSSTASTSATAATIYTQTAAGTGRFSLGSTYRYSVRLKLNTIANVRYWIILADTISGTTGFSTDTPNQKFIGFRYSAGTDTTWQACVGVDSVNQECSDTGTTAGTTDTLLFEMSYHTTGVDFNISGQPAGTVGQVTTLPPQSTLVHMAVIADNKNTNNSAQFTIQYMTLTLQ